MISKGIRKIDENVICNGRTIITTEEKSFDSMPVGSIYVDPDTGKQKIKVKNKTTWVPLKAGIYSGSEPPSDPQPGDLWLDTSKDSDSIEDTVKDINIGNITGAVHISKTENLITIDKPTDTINFIGGTIKKYDPKDIMIVIQNNVPLIKDRNFTLSKDCKSIKNLNGNWEASKEVPITFYFLVVETRSRKESQEKPNISKEEIEKILEDQKLNIATDIRTGSLELKEKTNTICFNSIGEIINYNPKSDKLLNVFVNRTKLTKGVHYEINEENKTIKSLNGEWDGTKKPILFEFQVLTKQDNNIENINANTEGIIKINKEITSLKDSQITKEVIMDIVNKNNEILLNKINKMIESKIVANNNTINQSLSNMIETKITNNNNTTNKTIDTKITANSNTLKQYIDQQKLIIKDSTNKQEYKFIVEDGKPKIEVIK